MNNALVSSGQAQRLQRHSPSVPELNLHEQVSLPYLSELSEKILKTSPSVPELSARIRKHSALSPIIDPGQNKPLPPLPAKTRPIMENIQQSQDGKMDGWYPVEKARSFGIALSSLNPTKQIQGDFKEKVLSLLLGDSVRILGECQDWAYIRKIDSGKEGIVPKSYLFRPDFETFSYNSTEIVKPKRREKLEELELDEVTDVLKEWHSLLIKYYLARKSEKFKNARTSIAELHELRTSKNFKKQPKEELKDLQKKFATFIDERNAVLGLDVRVRDENGLILDPRKVSVVEFLRKHQLSVNSTSLDFSKGTSKRLTSYNSFALLVTITADLSKCAFDHEIRFYLYDGKEQFQFSESAYFYFDSDNKSLQKHKSQILFTDLDGKDIQREKVYLVAAIVRHGPMEFKDPDTIKKESKRNASAISPLCVKLRRPCGMAIRDITDVLKNHALPVEQLEMNYAQFIENDGTLDGTLKKLIAPDRNSRDRIPGGQVWDIKCEIRALPGGSDIERQFVVVRKMEFPEVILPTDMRNDLYVTIDRGEFQKGTGKTTDKNVEVTVSIHDQQGKKLKDPYIHPGKGPSHEPLRKYASVVYYHEPKPRWDETFIVSLPNKIANFSKAHLRFYFHHRSTRDKDNQDKPFAVSYLPLQSIEDTVVPDASHQLQVFKIDSKYFKEKKGTKLRYMELRALKQHNQNTVKQTVQFLTFNPKDVIFITTKLCSLNFTQSPYVSRFLKWHSSELYDVSAGENLVRPEALDVLTKILKDLREIKDVEYMKFLHNIFNKLFTILFELGNRQNQYLDTDVVTKYEVCEGEVFDCLLHILGKISDEKYISFQSVVDDYIENHISDPLVFKTLFRQINDCLSRFRTHENKEKSKKIIDNIDFLFKIIVSSYQIRIKLMKMHHGVGMYDPSEDEDPERDFKEAISEFFTSAVEIVKEQNLRPSEQTELRRLQARVLNNIPYIIDTLCCSATSAHSIRRELIYLLIDVIQKVPAESALAVHQLKLIQDIVDSPLFLDKDCRTSVIPVVISCVKPHLPSAFEELRRPSVVHKALKVLGLGLDTDNQSAQTPAEVDNLKEQQTEKCIELLGNVMNKLHRTDIGPVKDNISHLMQDLLESTITAVATMTTRNSSTKPGNTHKPVQANMVTILLSFFAKMDEQHYIKLCDALKLQDTRNNNNGQINLSAFMENVLMSIKNLFSYDHFPNRWSDMILLQNSIILQALWMFSETIKVEFNEPFDKTPWLSFFRCATDFITQKSLRLEKFSPQKAASILKMYGDMRVPAAELVLNMWQGLGASKKHYFLHGRDTLIHPFLEMTLVPEKHIRQSTMSVFYDMIRCEYDNDQSVPKTFKNVENIFMKILVDLVEAGKADEEYRNIFTQVMTKWCNGDMIGLKDRGLDFVDTVDRFLDLLLQFREVAHEENPSNKMTCYVNLLNLSQQINRKDLYIKYLYKLVDLQKQTESYTEAAFVLKRHAKQLDWTDDPLPLHLHSKDHPRAQTHMELKELLYNDIINYFKKANMYECALEMCDELQQIYREETFNYSQLVILLREMAEYYKAISDRRNLLLPKYYRVGFYGRGFPSFLQGKEYIYRNKDSEMLAVFESRILQIYPKAEVLRRLVPPTDEIRNSQKQYLLMYEVKPVPGKITNHRRLSAMKNANTSVQQYYLGNEVDVFIYDRPIEYPSKQKKINEFSTSAVERTTYISTCPFPGILSWFPVLQEKSVTIRPIELAVELILKYGEGLRKLIYEQHEAMRSNTEALSANNLPMELKGILDAAVNGGLPKYEEAFLSDEYLEENRNDMHNVEKLKECIVGLIPILREGLKIHEIQGGNTDFHNYLKECFEKFRKHIEEKYAVNTSALKDEELVRTLGKITKQFTRSSSEAEAVRRDVPGTRNSTNLGGIKTSSSLSFLTMGHLASTKNLYSSSTNKLSSTKSFSRQESERSGYSKPSKASRRLTGPIPYSNGMHQEQNTVHENFELVTQNGMVHRVNEISQSSESVRSSSQASFVRQDALHDDCTGSGSSHRRSYRWSSSSYTGLLGPSSSANSMNNIASEDESSQPPPLPPKKERHLDYSTDMPPPKPPL